MTRDLFNSLRRIKELEAEVERLTDALETERGHREADRNEARAEVERLRLRFVLAYTPLRAIASDENIDCWCGEPPYTDGELCPGCCAASAVDILDTEAAKAAGGNDV